MNYQGKISEYLSHSFGWDVKFGELGILKNKISFGLLRSADYSIFELKDIKAVAIKLQPEDDFRFVKNLAKTVRKMVGMETLLVFENIDSYQRRSLIENRINFIVPDRQVYLPSVGIMLNERGLGMQQHDDEKLSPVATAVIISFLEQFIPEGISISDIAQRLGYSIKTLSLAISELERHGIVSTYKEGRAKKVLFPKGRKSIWEQAYPLMINPVEKILYTDNVKLAANIGVKASDTALSEISMLAGPQQDVYAVYARDPRLNELDLNPNDGTLAIEIWKINPILTAKNGIADPFSLALTYKEEDDPRVNNELEKVLSESLIFSE